MATTGHIPSNITLGASQSVRRNAANDGFEAFTPGAGGTGDVVGPASAGANMIATFFGTTGKLIADSGFSISNVVDTSYSGLVPVGGIIMWSGTVAAIPTNWHLCDGTASTPDLRDKFIVGAKQDDGGAAKTNLTGSLTQSGGSVSHHHADHAVTQPSAHSTLSHSGAGVGDHAAHTHNVTSNVAVADHAATNTGAASAGATQRGTSASTLTLAAHTHQVGAYTHAVTNNAVTSGDPSATLTHSVMQPSAHSISAHSGAAVDAHDTLSSPQPYYALAFIMRTA